MIEHIVAIDEKNGIARDGMIPWDVPEDVQFFREFVADKRLLVGRETYEQIGRSIGAYMYVVSSHNTIDPPLDSEWGEIVHDLPLFLDSNADEPLVVIGGQGIYRATMHVATKLHVTHIEGDWQCDRQYPVLPKDFVRTTTSGVIQSRTGASFRFETYERV
ncbi:MAG: dihydrofolate reductase [Patescibacteria group bacterium]|nr:dihydrofolate reductase [Patescibacteria group bacterium]